MAFKMRGFSGFKKETNLPEEEQQRITDFKKKLKEEDYEKYGVKPEPEKQLLKSEHKDTEITGGSLTEEVADINDRIQFIEEDISNQGGKMTPAQRKDIVALNKQLIKLKN